MFLARVVGQVWSSVKWKELEGLKFLLVRPYSLSDLKRVSGLSPERKPCHDAVVVADVLGAGPGEDVVIAYGHAARVGMEELLGPEGDPSRPIDAAVVGIVDRFQIYKEVVG